jgi:hypothetical protein
MSQLARTPPSLRRLFQEIDLAPLPQSRVGLQALASCIKHRKNGRVTLASARNTARIPLISPHALIAESIDDDYSLRDVGSAFAALLGVMDGALTTAGNRRLAARLRRAFDAAWVYGDPVVFQFHLRARKNHGMAVELLVVPLSPPRSGLRMVLAVLATRPIGGGWEL